MRVRHAHVRATIAAIAVLFLMSIASPAAGRQGLVQRAPRASTGSTAHVRDAKPMPGLAPVRSDALTRALDRGRIAEARYALARASSLFHLRTVRARYGAVRVADPRSATMILRDLVLRLDDLGPVGQARARAILARPTDGAADPQEDGYSVPEATPYCTTNACIHYVTSTPDAPDPTDANADGVPDYVETAAQTVEQVWSTEVTAYGYRAPKSDLTSVNNGGSALIDVYLAQIGNEGLYGYCTTDDPNAMSGSGYEFYDFSAYCVVDNDFSPDEFTSGASGVQALQVTAAHEFFHAVQFAYDAAEDSWFMESTATWMEDEVFDDVNDNQQYFPDSPIGTPDVPLDYNRGFGVYGDWIFIRYLSEAVGDPSIIRGAWERADASPTGSDAYSTKALDGSLDGFGGDFISAFADFAMVNDAPVTFYSEGADYPYPPPERRVKVTARNGGAVDRSTLDHLTNRYVWFIPGNGVRSSARLYVSMDGPASKAGTEGSVAVFFSSGQVRFFPLAIAADGSADIVVPFGKGKVDEVDLVLTNASTRRGACWQDPRWEFACAAFPKDDGMSFAYGATLLQ